MNSPKQYDAVIKFGATTATDDPESPEEIVPGVTPLEQRPVANALCCIRPRIAPISLGAISQRPPKFSAMKIAGRRAYDLARKGKEVKLEPRTVRIDDIAITGYEWLRCLRVRIDCGRGTSIFVPSPATLERCWASADI